MTGCVSKERKVSARFTTWMSPQAGRGPTVPTRGGRTPCKVLSAVIPPHPHFSERVISVFIRHYVWLAVLATHILLSASSQQSFYRWTLTATVTDGQTEAQREHAVCLSTHLR